jgi:hypothetical protein
MHERWDRLMRFDSPRYIRCYDSRNAGERYTVVYSNLKIFTPGYGSSHFYVGMSAAPYHPQGVGIHGESQGVPIDYPSYGHLGRKISFADLPLDCQIVVLDDYCDYWNLKKQDHPLWDSCRDMEWWNRSTPEWRPVRPPKGQFDSRSDASHRREKAVLNDLDMIQGWVMMVVDVEISKRDIAMWSYADRAEVMHWAGMMHLRASDNPVRVPEVPSILLQYGRTRIHV